MATVRLSDAVIPLVYESYGQLNNVESTAFYQSGVIATSPIMDAIAKRGGMTGIMPFWKDLDQTIEPNMSNDDPADNAVPMKITSGTMNYRKVFLNQGFSDMDLVAELSGSDPMQAIKSRTDTYWARQAVRRLIASLKGVIADNIANASGDMGVNISGLSGSLAVINHNAVTDATYTLGDVTGGLSVVAMHSQIKAQLVKQQLIVYLRDANTDIALPTYLGYQVVVDDQLVWSGSGPTATFLTCFIGQGAIGFAGASGHLFAMGEGIPKVASEIRREPSQGHGGGEETLWERKTWIIHPMGFNWIEGTLSEFSPKLSDLSQAAHWTRVVARKQVPFAYLLSKAN